MDTETKEKLKDSKLGSRVSGAEGLVISLLEEGADTLFGYPGGAIMPVYDAMYQYEGQIRHILARHEQGAAHAAQGYARANGKVGVAMATSGPGATNLITGIADAQIDSTALVCITGQVTSQLLGTDAFQETDIIGISLPVTKWSYQVTKAEEIPWAIAKAFYIARSGRPGPVLIDITKDAQMSDFEYYYEPCNDVRSYLPNPPLQMEQVEYAASLINNAKKPMLLVGQGVLIGQAQEEFKALAEKADIPVGSTLLGLSAFPSNHRLFTGMLGMHGNYAPNIKTNDCDVLISVGMRFDDRVTGDLSRYAKQAKIVHFDIDEAEIGKNLLTDAPVLANCKEALQAILPLIKAAKHEAWLQEYKDLEAIEYEKVIENDIHPDGDQLKMAEVVHLLSELTDGQATIATDVGQHQMITARYYKYNATNSNLTSGGLGTMGFGLPSAFGAKVGTPNKQVIAISGDGGFQMNIQELGTIMQEGTAVKMIILNNSFLGMVRQWQELFFDKRYASTDMVSPNFQILADAYNIQNRKVEQRVDLKAALQEMLDADGSYLLEVIVEQEGNVFPMVATGASVSEVRLS
jgi:acetolactate synthase I/II/III large subunit